MPRKTDGEKVDELEKSVAILIERVDTVREQIKLLADLTTKTALLEQHVSDMKKGHETRGNRIWSLMPPLLAGAIGGAIALLTHYLASSR
jgi:hypothetical protein